VARFDEVPKMVDFVFLDRPAIDEASWEKAVARDEGAPGILAAAAAAYAACPWEVDDIREATVGVAEAAGRKLGKAQAPIRVAVTGWRSPGGRSVRRSSSRWPYSGEKRS
jgi:glutamyl-tRNA synthetase